MVFDDPNNLETSVSKIALEIYTERLIEAMKCLHCTLFHYPECPNNPNNFGQPDLVNHPPHYTANPSGVECIDVTEHFNFNRGNAIKYIWRAESKGSELQDLEKAAWYLAREIERIQNNAESKS